MSVEENLTALSFAEPKPLLASVDDSDPVQEGQVVEFESKEVAAVDFEQESAPQPVKVDSAECSKCRSSLASSHPRRAFWNIRCSCYFSYIPDELLVSGVFTFLAPNELAIAASVCRRWNHLSSDATLWRTLDMSKSPAKLSDDVLAKLLDKYGPSVEILKLCNCKKLSQAILQRIGALTGSLREVHFCGVTATDDVTVIRVAERNALSLEHVSLFGCPRVSDRSVRFLCESTPKLMELSVRNCPLLTSNAIVGLGAELRGLNLSGCPRITDLVPIATKCSSLERLNLHGLRLSDEAVEAIARGCARLSSLHLSSANPFGGSSRLSDACLIALSNLTDLKCLNLQGNGQLSDEALSTLSRSRCRLERLDLSGCFRLTDTGLSSYLEPGADAARHLTHLSLARCYNLTDQALSCVARSCPRLVHLDVQGCVGVGYTGLKEVLENCTQLQTLDMGGCAGVAPEELEGLRSVRPGVKMIYF